MPQVVIQFEGICVNFKRADFPFLPTAHRIVLINAQTITQVWDQTIAPHAAGFSTSLSPDTATIPLYGTVMSISNPVTTGTQTGVTYDPTYDQLIPRLGKLTPGLNAAEVSLAVLVGHNPALTACYFDVEYGVISATSSTFGAAMTVVTIETIGEPTYQYKPFPSGLSSTPIPVAQEPQPATNTMFFFNEEALPSEASDNDFLLSYLVVASPPLQTPNLPPAVPGGTSPNRKSTLLPAATTNQFFTDVGCSNSGYP